MTGDRFDEEARHFVSLLLRWEGASQCNWDSHSRNLAALLRRMDARTREECATMLDGRAWSAAQGARDSLPESRSRTSQDGEAKAYRDGAAAIRASAKEER